MKSIVPILLIATSLHAEAHRGFPVTPHQVVRALAQRNLEVADDQIALVANIVADSPEPSLEVESAQRVLPRADDARVRTQVRLVCRRPSACIPFYAVVVWPLATPQSTLAALEAAPVVHASTPPVSMRAGTNATLIVDTPQMHISVPVISLQDGSLGKEIRVTSLDRKRNYLATVIGPNLLAGRL